MIICIGWRRHSSIVALLAAATLVGSFVFASNETEEVQNIHRQLGSKRAKLSQFRDPKNVALRARTDAPAVAARDVSGPNVIYIQHESLSGSVAFNTGSGVKAMPFFQHMMHKNPNMYVFEHGRTVSGSTIDAMPALMTGCLPYTRDAVKWIQKPGKSIGYSFRHLGYRTASFCSRALDDGIKTGQWKMLYDGLAGGMDKVVDPLSQNWTLDNAEGSDDRRMLPLIEEWLLDLEKEGGQRPFYAQMHNFNTHYPYMKEKKRSTSSNRYYQSMATADQFLKRLFNILARTGRFENTIVVGSGDHGEDPFKKAPYVRLQALNSNILHSASYIYYPQQLMPDPSIAVLLRSNTQKLVHTLDMYQTIQGIIGGNIVSKRGKGRQEHEYVRSNAAPEGCITGVDLGKVNVTDDRVVISWNLGSSQSNRIKPARFWALSTKELSLYHRMHKKKQSQLKQGKNSTYVLEYGECTRNTSHFCQASLNEEHKEYFRGAIQWIKDSPLYDERVKTSELVEFFSKVVGWKETAEEARM